MGALIMELIRSGLGNLAAYLAAHVLLCLLPAFFIAGALTALIPRESITPFLGRQAPRYLSYPIAALAGFVLAVCSCTILPLFAGIYKKGAGLGPAVTFLFVGPAINILAVSYTGVAIGLEMAMARIILSILFGIGIGLIMAQFFRKDDAERDQRGHDPFATKAKVPRRSLGFLVLLLVILVASTLQVGILTDSYAQIRLPLAGAHSLQETLNRLVPYDPSRGEEGVTVQGVILIGLLVIIAGTSWRGLNTIDERYNRWSFIAMGSIAVTLLFAALKVETSPGWVILGITGKWFSVVIGISAVVIIAQRFFDEFEIREWIWETWRFAKQIFPLLLIGVFVVGFVRPLIRPEWIQGLVGSNTIPSNLIAAGFGIFMYFPTLVEVVVARLFLTLGMHPGPLLVYLVAGPGLSLQSILITASIIGRTKTLAYVICVALFGTIAGLTYGAWVDGMSALILLPSLMGGIALLILILHLISRRQTSLPEDTVRRGPSRVN